MESFGSSLLFGWLKVVALVWLQFGYSSCVWTKQCWLAMPLVVRGWAASLRAIPHFGIETTQEEEYQKCNNSVSLWSPSVTGSGRWALWLVTTCQVLDSATAPRHLPMIDSSVGRSSAQEWQGSGVRGRGHREQGHILAPEGPTAILLYNSAFYFFKAREGLHILTLFPLFLFLFRGFGPVFEKKSFWGINT